jgi:threonine synthase
MDENGTVVKAPDIEAMRREIFAVCITDSETRAAISDAYNRFDTLLEPHGAVGWAGLARYLKEVEDWSPCVSLETADPAKFPEEVVRAVGLEPPVPESMALLDGMEERFDLVAGEYGSFKEKLSELFRG